MKIILLTIFILILLYVFFYIKNNKSNKENIINIGDDKNKQPSLLKPVYDYNLEAATALWKSSGCTNGSWKPTPSNRDIWAVNNWAEKVNDIRQKSDKFINNEEMNFNEWKGVNGKGILDSYKKCHDANANEDTFHFPKPGDRIKIRKIVDDKKSEYYSGIVLANEDFIDSKSPTNLKGFLEGDFKNNEVSCEKNKNCLVLLDKKVDSNGNEEDRKKSKNFEIESNSIDVKKIIEKFGFPYFFWNRHIDRNKQKDSLFPAATWIKLKNKNPDKFGFFDTNEIFVTEKCDPTTSCDYLNCKVRKKKIVTDNPITYFCEENLGNSHIRQTPTSASLFCEHNNGNSSKVIYYFDKDKMCSEDYKYYSNNIGNDTFNNDGTKKLKNKLYFCKQDCVNGKCGDAMTINEKEEELLSKYRLVILVSNGARAFNINSDPKDYDGEIAFIHVGQDNSDDDVNEPSKHDINVQMSELGFSSYQKIHFEILTSIRGQWQFVFAQGSSILGGFYSTSLNSADTKTYYSNEINRNTILQKLEAQFFTEIKCEYRFYEHDSYRKERDRFYFEGVPVIMENGIHKVDNTRALNDGWNVRRRDLGRAGPQVAPNTSTYGGRRGRHDDYSSYNNDGFVKDVRVNNGNTWVKHVDVKRNCHMKANTDSDYRGKGWDYPGPHHNLGHQGMGDKISALEFRIGHKPDSVVRLRTNNYGY